MEDDWILAKTAAGAEEIASRARRIPPRLRTLLILVDGRRTAAELIHTAAALGDPRAGLLQLYQHGFVALADHTPVASSRSAAPPQGTPQFAAAHHVRTAATPHQRRSLALARLYLQNAMEQSLRYGDQPVRERLREATSRAELIAVFELCRQIAAEIGVGHIDVITHNFYAMLPDEN